MKVIPEMVEEDKDGFYRVAYQKLQFLLLQSIKELKQENDHLNDQNIVLRKKLDELGGKVESLMASLE